MGALLLPPLAARRRHVSLQLCAAAEARYGWAVGELSTLLALVLPPPMPVGVVAPKALPDTAAYYMLTSVAQLVLSFAAPLAWLARREWRARVEFARSQRAAAAVQSLHRQARGWRLGPLQWCMLAAVVWCWGLAIAQLTGPGQ